MNVLIHYCKQCKAQGVSGTGFFELPYQGYCPNDRTHILESFETEVEIPKPHIEKGTLIRVWNDDKDNSVIFPFHSFFSLGVWISTKHSGVIVYKNYELITPDEINPDVKKH